jgi:hypothetical protein
MKQLIRRILKEEVENDYNMIDKGIDIVVKVVNKTFPFIVGWEKNGDYDESKYYLYIDLKVNVDKVKEYYDLPFKDYYLKYPDVIDEQIERKESFAYPFSLLDFSLLDDDPYIESKKIKTLFEEMYELIPNEYKMKEERQDIFGKINVHEKDININYYMFVR